MRDTNNTFTVLTDIDLNRAQGGNRFTDGWLAGDLRARVKFGDGYFYRGLGAVTTSLLYTVAPAWTDRETGGRIPEYAKAARLGERTAALERAAQQAAGIPR
jgi:hypothetical protein